MLNIIKQEIEMEKGRNKDYHITEMDNYQQMKNNIEVHQKNLKLVERKTEDLSDKTKEIREILENLKTKGLIKSRLVLKVVDRNMMLAFIKLVDKTIIEYQSISELTTTLKEAEIELLNNRSRLKLLDANNKDLSLEVDNLTESIKQKNEEIYELKKEKLNLKSLLQKIKDKFYFIKHFIIHKILDYKEKDKYVKLTRDLYKHKRFNNWSYRWSWFMNIWKKETFH